MPVIALRPAAAAFDAAAPGFDVRFGAWDSVSAQRRAVREALVRAFPAHSKLLEIGGGTGEDARWLCAHGFEVTLTDPSPAMVRIAMGKLTPPSSGHVLAAEDLEGFAEARVANRAVIFDGAYSNFAALNCVRDLAPVGRGLARLVRPGGVAALVLFGSCSPGDMIVEVLRGRFRSAFRRCQRGEVEAHIGQQEFKIVYHRPREVTAAMSPWFDFERRLGVGVFVPPSGAEPWISEHPALLRALEAFDRMLTGPLAPLGDHVFYQFRRNTVPA